MTYREVGCGNCLVNFDAWRVTPRQWRRFHKKLHRAGVFYEGLGLEPKVSFK